MKIVLYYSKQDLHNPVYTFVKCLNEFYQLQIQFEPCSLAYSAAGPLPLLKIESYLIGSHDIIDVLSNITGIDSELSSDNLIKNKLISDLCVYRIHPNTLCSLSSFSIYSKLNMSSAERFKNMLRHPVRTCLSVLGVRDNDKNYLRLFEEADGCNKVLSEILAEQKVFCENFEGDFEPKSSDFVVFCYLKEALECLPPHFHITESLRKYKNLSEFIENMGKLPASSRLGGVNLTLFDQYLQEKSIKFSESSIIKENSEDRRKIVSMISLSILGYMLINN